MRSDKPTRPFRLIPIIAGLILIFASAAKQVALFREGNDWEGPQLRWLQILLIEIELFLGLWLLSRRRPALARLFSLATFLTFAFANTKQILHGNETCNCLGAISVDPWFMLAIDIVLIGLVYSWRPHSESVLLIAPGSRRPRWNSTLTILASVLFLSLSLLAHQWLTSHRPSAATLVADHGVHDFGTVDQGQTLRHVFTLQNNAAHPIEIMRVHSTCSCSTTEDLAGTLIQPGHNYPVEVSLKTGDGEGERHSRITIYFKHPRQRGLAFLWFEVHANVLTDYWVHPLLIDFGELTENTPKTRQVTVRPNRATDLSITRIEVADPIIQARQVAPTSDSHDLVVELSLVPQSHRRHGAVSVPVRIFTSSPRNPVATILVQAQISPWVEVDPAAIVLVDGSASPRTQELRFRCKVPIRIKSATASDSAITCKIIKQIDHEPELVSLTIPVGNAPAPNSTVKIEIEQIEGSLPGHTSSIVVPVLRVPPAQKGP